MEHGCREHHMENPVTDHSDQDDTCIYVQHLCKYDYHEILEHSSFSDETHLVLHVVRLMRPLRHCMEKEGASMSHHPIARRSQWFLGIALRFLESTVKRLHISCDWKGAE